MVVIDTRKSAPVVDKLINQACGGAERPLPRHDGVVSPKYLRFGRPYRPSDVSGAVISVPMTVERLRQRALLIEAQQARAKEALENERRTYGTFDLPPTMQN